MTQSRIAVLGAGALGLTAALRFAQSGHQVVVLEREPVAGGLAAGFHPAKSEAVWLEKFYHHLFQSDHHAIRLIEELGLGADLTWHRPRTVVLRDGRLHQLDSPPSLLRFTPLPFPSRVRMAPPEWITYFVDDHLPYSALGLFSALSLAPLLTKHRQHGRMDALLAWLANMPSDAPALDGLGVR